MPPDDAELPTLVMKALYEVVPEAADVVLEPADGLREQLDIDSMDILNFAIAIHARTGIDVPERDYVELESLDQTLAYLRKRKG